MVNADVAIVTGTNTTANHPVASSFFKQARRHGTKIIYVDPRADKMADHADIFCQLKPGTDVAFYNGVMHEVIRLGLVDARVHREPDVELRRARRDGRRLPARAGRADHRRARRRDPRVARAWGEARAGIIFWGMGISQHTTGTDNARCLIALCAITGNVGRPGSGLHPLRGPEQRAGRLGHGPDPDVLPRLPAGRRPGRPGQVRAGLGHPDLDPKRGLTVTEIIGSALKGGVRGMYMLGENPFLSDPNINKVRKALAALDFLVVQDIFLTETAEFADVILPASSYLEKDGTYTNTDRRVQLGRKVLDPPGQARVDWEVVQDIANRIGLGWNYTSAREVFDEIVSVMASYTNLSYDNLGLTGKLYPNPDPEHSDGTVVMFGEQFNTDDGLAHLVPAEWLPAKELPDEEYPFVLNTGRLLEHWHTGSMTRRSYALDAIAPVAEVYLHPDDAAGLGIADGEMARVSSRRGTIELAVRVSHREQRGNCFIPFHFREAAANLLTIDEIDPVGKIPEFKFCAVRIEAARPAGPLARRPRAGRTAGNGHSPRARARRRGQGGQVPRPEPDPGAQRDPGAGRLAAARGAGGAGPRRAPAAVRDRGADLVLPALPHRAAQAGRAARLPRPVVLAARRGRADRGDPAAVRGGRRRRVHRGVLHRPLRRGARRQRQRAPGGGGRRRRRSSPPRGTAGCRRRSRAATRAGGRGPTTRTRRWRERYGVLRARAGRRAGHRPDHHGPAGLRAARDGRRRFPDRAGSGSWSRRRRPRRSTPSATPTSPSRGPSRTGRSWPSSRTWCSRACCSGCSRSGRRRAGCSSGTSTAPRSR